MALRWKKNPRPRGLMGIGSGPQGSTLRDGDREYASTGYVDGRWTERKTGWYWVAGYDSGVPHKNTCMDPVADEATAKLAAMAYVREHLIGQARADDQEGQ